MKIKVSFAREFYESFTGTQEELDALTKEISNAIENGNYSVLDPAEDYPVLSEVVLH